MTHLLGTILTSKGHEVCTVSGDTPVTDCITKMCELNIGSIIVMDGDKVVGLFTEREAVRRIYLKEMNLQATAVSTVMNPDFIPVTSQTTVGQAMDFFVNKRTRHLPVFEDGKLSGMISIGDVTKWIIDQQQNEIDHLSGYIHS